jgi:hypothetical protein
MISLAAKSESWDSRQASTCLRMLSKLHLIPRILAPLLQLELDAAIDVSFGRILEPYLVYLINQERANGSLKNIDLHDQKTAPLTPNSFVYNRHPFSQAGRRPRVVECRLTGGQFVCHGG